MALRPLEPKSSASANSATLAQDCSHYIVRSLAGVIGRTRRCDAPRAVRAALRSAPFAFRRDMDSYPPCLLVSRSPGPSTCNPSCASHSPASNCPEGPMIRSKTGTRKACHKMLRSASVSRCSPGRSSTTSACVSEGIRSSHSNRHCSMVAATAQGSKRAASSPHPCGNIFTACDGSSAGRNQGTRTAVRGAGGTG